MNTELLHRYATVLVQHGLNVQPGQALYLRGEQVHRELAHAITEAAYDLGCEVVHWALQDPLEQALLIQHGKREQIALYHEKNQRWCHEVVRSKSAALILTGEEFPDLMTRLAREFPERHALFIDTKTRAQSVFSTYGINARLCPWLLAAGPTPAWARQLFPRLPAAARIARLTELLAAVCYADSPAALQVASARTALLKRRIRALDELAITELHISGGGNDLRVAISPRARWQGGQQRTLSGQTFHPNLPSEEVFITPDCRRTQGCLKSSRPFRTTTGVLVEDLDLHFQRGQIVEFAARHGQGALSLCLESDPKSRYLGELALVGRDSPLAQSGLYFDRILLDENASSHVALGSGFAWAFAGGESLSQSELQALGCNLAATHTDIPFGSVEVTVVANHSREGEVVLLEAGSWNPRFADGGTI